MKFHSQNTISALKDLLSAAFVALVIFSCRSAEVLVDSTLKMDSEIHNVKGLQGFHVGQVLSFGSYTTSKVKRGWTFSYSLPFIVRFNGANEKLSFQLLDNSGNAAEVALVSRFKETEYRLLDEYFSVSLKYKNYAAGSLKMTNANEAWDFVVHHVDGNERSLNRNSTAGFIRNGHSRIDIVGIRELEGAPSIITQNDVYGYEFRIDGQPIASVSTINNGKVWLKNGLSPDIKIVLAGVSSALMLRNSVENEIAGVK